jgi:hypothetical protein
VNIILIAGGTIHAAYRDTEINRNSEFMTMRQFTSAGILLQFANSGAYRFIPWHLVNCIDLSEGEARELVLELVPESP